MVNFFTMLGSGVFVVFILMTALWFVYYFNKNAGIVDLGWTLTFLVTVWGYVLLGNGFWMKKVLLASMVTIWSGRLLWYLRSRLTTGDEDPRYVEIRNTFGGENSDLKFYALFLVQGLIALVLTLPFMIVCGNAETGWNTSEVLGIILWVIGVVGESLADQQLSKFKRNPENQGRVCRKGLWRFSRHPNYFFEFIVWVGYFFFALPTPWGVFAIIAPILMLILLLEVSGVPMAEAQALKTKGLEYEEYQKKTSVFIPWFPGK